MSDVAPPVVPQPAQPPHPAAMQPVVDPSRTAALTPWGHLVVAALAVVGLTLNVIGGAGFPSNAPVEWVMNAGITIDIVAVALACGIGIGVSARMRPARPSRVFPWLGLAFAAVALVIWAVMSGGMWETLLGLGRGRYMDDTSGAFVAGIGWALGGIFSAYGLRRRQPAQLNAAAWAGIALWAVVLVGVVASALLYAADLTD